MTAARALLMGYVESRVASAAGDAIYREIVLTEKPGDVSTLWSVRLASSEADVEADDLAEGDVIAFAGVVECLSGLDGRPLRRFIADRALTLRAPVSAPPSSPARPENVNFKDLGEMIGRVEALSKIIGAGLERQRIQAIMNAPDAIGRQSLAWGLAEAGLTVEAALEALRIGKLASTFMPIDQGASLTH